MVAPEPYFSACMEILDRQILLSRVWGWSREVCPEHLTDLMDATHNIPGLVRNWERCDVEWLRKSLGRYERKWAGKGGLPLLQIFDGIVAGENG